VRATLELRERLAHEGWVEAPENYLAVASHIVSVPPKYGRARPMQW
jgi:hypothetical protein